jgi:hypothetical protein
MYVRTPPCTPPYSHNATWGSVASKMLKHMHHRHTYVYNYNYDGHAPRHHVINVCHHTRLTFSDYLGAWSSTTTE